MVIAREIVGREVAKEAYMMLPDDIFSTLVAAVELMNILKVFLPSVRTGKILKGGSNVTVTIVIGFILWA